MMPSPAKEWPVLPRCPLPPDIAGLPTVEAQPWILIDGDPVRSGLEGPAFDADGNFYVCHGGPACEISRIFKVTPQMEKSVFWQSDTINPTGLAVHADGRFFAACITGEITIISSQGETLQVIRPEFDGQRLRPNDLTFDHAWNLYFTDWRGTVANEIGGVFRLEADSGYTVLTPILRGLCSPNGIAFSPDEKVLWIGESSRNQILRLAMGPDGLLASLPSAVLPVYRGMGRPMPDSNKTDSAGNLYQGIQWGGRILILNPDGVPVGNVVIPGREDGHLLMTPNLAIKPGTSQAYMVAAGSDGSWIYTFKTLAPA